MIAFSIKISLQPASLKEDPTEKEEKEVPAAEKKSTDNSEKPIISEADSTEPPKSNPVELSRDLEVAEASKEGKTAIPEGPPGVSPRRDLSPKPKKRTERQSSNHRQRDKPYMDSHSNRAHTSRRSPYTEPL